MYNAWTTADIKNLVFAVVHVLYVQHGVFSHRTVSIFLYTLLVGF